jgi:cystathionine gamma-synthase
MTDKNKLSPETISAQAMHQVDTATGGVVPAMHLSSTFARDENYDLLVAEHSYGRDHNPTYDVAEAVLRELEGAAAALLFSSGMAAAAAVLQSLKPGDHIVAPTVMYWGLRNWMITFCENWGIGLDLFDPSDPDGLENAIRKGETKLVWIETPCNPTWDVIDIAAAAEIAHGIGARLAVDSTVATPVLTQPIQHGADIVMHSATKYLGGHCDMVAGALLSAQEDEFWERICDVRLNAGATPGTFEAWLLQRSMRTLFLRVHKSSESAMAIATHFSDHPALEAALYPGLPEHPGHAIASRQMAGGYGGMLSLRIKGGAERALEMAGRCKVFIRATSLGGVESLIEHRYSIEGPTSPIPQDLLRLSIGVEAVEDLIDDLEQALS